MKTKAYLGIDPGANGAICLLVPETNLITFIKTTELPVSIYASIKQLEKDFNLMPVMIEDVSSIPGASAGSNFTFGFNVGLLQGIIKCTGVGLDFVRPKLWQKTVGVKIPKRVAVPKGAKKKSNAPALKKAVAHRILELYPDANIYGPKGGLLDGRSDALSIAHYARIKYGQD